LCGAPDGSIPGDGWDIEGPEWAEIRPFAETKDATLLPPSGDPDLLPLVWPRLLAIFFPMCAKAHQKADEVLAGRDNPAEHFRSTYVEIRNSLAHAIVPSTLLGKEKPFLAHPTAVINTAVAHWVNGMEGVFDLVSKSDPSSVKDNAFLEGRLELWAMKAVEDWLLTHRRKGGMSWPS
jgi:hypothetical protein